MHVLILEKDLNIDNFVLALKQNPNVGLIFASQDAVCNIDDVTKIDIDSDEVSELLDFALANEVSFVFMLSSSAQSSELKELFEMNDIQTFASSQAQYEYLLSRANVKKLIYKNKIPTLQFAVFEKINLALDWCRNAQYPIIIKSDMKDEIKQKFIADTYFKAQNIIEDLFDKSFDKIVIEQFVEGHYFSSYYLTDSSSHVHLANFYKNNNLTLCPDFQVSQVMQDIIFSDYYLKILESINYNFDLFNGVLKLDFVIVDEELYLVDISAGFNAVDFQMLLNILDADIFTLFSSISSGALEDFEGCMLLKDNYFASLEKSQEQPLFEDDDNIECIKLKENNFLYLAQASTVNRACEYLDED